MTENNYSALMIKRALTTSEGWDSVILPGIYPTPADHTSAPDANSGVLIVLPPSTNPAQRFISSTSVEFTRRRTANAWSAWSPSTISVDLVKPDNSGNVQIDAISIKNTNIQLPGNLGVKNLEVHPMPNSAEGGQIDLYDKADAKAAFIDIDSGGNFRVVTDGVGVTLFINRTTGDVLIPRSLSATGNLKGSGVIAEGTVYAGNTKAWLEANGNVYGTVWGGHLSTYLSNRGVRAWAAVQGNGAIISSFGFAAINRTNVGGYNFVMSTSNGAYAVTVGINGGSQNGAQNAHSANIWNRTPNSFSVQNSEDGGTSYGWRDWPEFYVIVVGP